MYSAYKLNKQGDNIQPWRTPFPIWNQSVVPCPVLTVASWPAYRFLKRQIRYSHLFQNFPQFIVIHAVKGFGRVNKAEIDVFLEFSCFFHDPADVGNLISGSSAFSKTSLNIRKFTVHIYARQQKRLRIIEQSFGLCGRRQDGMTWENSIETCILSYVKQIASSGLMHETECSGWVHWDDPEGWDGEGDETGVQNGEHTYTHGWFMSMFGKNHYNIVK